jgi:hypothetical protein
VYSLLQLTSVYLSPRTASGKWSLSQKSTVLIVFNACKNTCYLSVCCRIHEVPWNTPCISYMWLGRQSTIYVHNLTYTICSKSIYIHPPGQTRKHCFPASIGFPVWANQWWQTKKHCFSPRKYVSELTGNNFCYDSGSKLYRAGVLNRATYYSFSMSLHIFIF